MSTNQNTAYLTTEWLHQSAGLNGTPQTSLNALNSTLPYYTSPTYSWGYSVPAKVRLKLSEVERLRLVAKEDKKVKEILQKFAPHIEIEVDFE